MSTDIDVFKIYASPIRMWMMAVCSCLFVVCGWFVLLVGDSIFHQFIGGVAIVFFGFCTGAIMFRAIKHTGAVIILSPEGFIDLRVNKDPIAWHHVQNVSSYTISKQTMVFLEMEHQVLEKSGSTKMAALTWNANSALVGAEGIHITAQGLKISVAELQTKITDYALKYGR